MKKLTHLVFLFAAIAAGPVLATDSIFTWEATALNKVTGAPMEGVQFDWIFTDKTSGKRSTDVCVTGSSGTCAVTLTAVYGTKGSNVTAHAVAIKEGFDALTDYTWTPDGNRELLVAKMTAVATAVQNAAAAQAEIDSLSKQLSKAGELADIPCAKKMECDRVLALTQAFFLKVGDSKIDVSTPMMISTYKPQKVGGIGLSALRIRGKGEAAVISISTTCNEENDTLSKACLSRQLRIVKMYRPFIEEAIMKQ